MCEGGEELVVGRTGVDARVAEESGEGDRRLNPLECPDGVWRAGCRCFRVLMKDTSMLGTALVDSGSGDEVFGIIHEDREGGITKSGGVCCRDGGVLMSMPGAILMRMERTMERARG